MGHRYLADVDAFDINVSGEVRTLQADFIQLNGTVLIVLVNTISPKDQYMFLKQYFRFQVSQTNSFFVGRRENCS